MCDTVLGLFDFFTPEQSISSSNLTNNILDFKNESYSLVNFDDAECVQKMYKLQANLPVKYFCD